MELTNIQFEKIQEQLLLEKLSEIIPMELVEIKEEMTEAAILKAATSYIRLLEKIIEMEC